MDLGAFLDELARTGHAVVPNEAQGVFPGAAEALLEQAWRADREALPGAPPPYDAQAALWAATRLYHACRFMLIRNADAEEVRAGMTEPCPSPPGPGTAYSADIPLRHLPQVAKMAKGIAADDPLTRCLFEIARDWPLSSVGIDALTDVRNVEYVLASPSLARLYVDRIIRARDAGRLGDARTLALVRSGLGLYAKELWPGFDVAVESLSSRQDDGAETEGGNGH